MQSKTQENRIDDYSDEANEQRKLVGSSQVPPKSLRDTSTRWVFLSFASFLDLGSVYCIGVLRALQTNLEQDLGISTFQYNLFFSVYSLPNIILPLFGGYFIDRVGARRSGLIFQSIIFIGQIIFNIGAYLRLYWLMILGRFIFALGGDNVAVAASAIIPKWFGKKELGLALGISLAETRLVASLDSFLTPKLYAWSGSLTLPILSGLIACVIAFCVQLTVNYLDVKREESEGIKEEYAVNNSKKVSLGDIKYFSSSIWLIIGLSAFTYTAFFPFLNIANDLVMSRFAFSSSSAGNLLAIIFVISVVLSPIMGYVTDKYGRRMKLILTAITILIASYVMMLLTPNSSEPNYFVVLPIIMMGIFFAMFTSIIWPCYSLVVDHKYLGTAIGLGFASNHTAHSLAVLVVGYLKDHNTDDGHKGYKYVIMFLGSLAVLGAFFTAALWRADNSNGEVLNKPPVIEATEINLPTPQRLVDEDDTEEMKTIVSN